MRRLAKNILRNIVGHYLDRDRTTMEILHKLHVFPPLLVDAFESKDVQRFGELIDKALQLKKEIDPGSSNVEMEKIIDKFLTCLYHREYCITAVELGLTLREIKNERKRFRKNTANGKRSVCPGGGGRTLRMPDRDCKLLLRFFDKHC